MKGTPAVYLGRIVDKNNFRAFIYATDGKRRLVESWGEFESCMQSGLWFASADDAKRVIEPVVEEKPKAKRQVKSKKPEVQEGPLADVEEMPADDMAFEVKDDFLPKG